MTGGWRGEAPGWVASTLPLVIALCLMLARSIITLADGAAAPVAPLAQPAMTRSAADCAELAGHYLAYRRELREGVAARQALLRHWQGPLHDVMAALGDCFMSGRHRVDEVLALMGAPDAIIAEGARHQGTPVRPGQRVLVYWWRGGHDYLYFVVSGGVVESAQWYYAGE